jgi:hypothetical protein
MTYSRLLTKTGSLLFRPPSSGKLQSADSIVSYQVVQYHEGPQDIEKPSPHPRGHHTDLAAIYAKDSGYQEG